MAEPETHHVSIGTATKLPGIDVSICVATRRSGVQLRACYSNMSSLPRMLRWTLSSLLLAAFAMPLASQDLPAGYAGSEMCQVCHEDTFLGFQKNPHALLEKSERWKKQGIACESCHQPAQAHAESMEVVGIVTFRAETPRRIDQACLECHGTTETHKGRSFSSHSRNSVSCVSCHRIHQEGGDLVPRGASADELCSSCHLDVRAAFNRPFRHKLQEGAISCVDCHNPHGDPPPAMMTRVSANELVCLKCHADKRGPFPFEHAPVKLEPCSTCHEPHGSSNPRMMARHDVTRLCLECHTTSLLNLGGSPPAFHDLRSARFQNCTICHSKIHGSFVSKDFLR
jgi:DmsE family decaheme c-type cytochrome